MNNSQDIVSTPKDAMRETYRVKMREIHGGKNDIDHGPDDVISGVASMVQQVIAKMSQESMSRRREMRQSKKPINTIH